MGGPQGRDGRRVHDPRRIARFRRYPVCADPGTLESGQGRAVTAGRRYVVGIAMVAAAGVGLSFGLPPAPRGAVWFALGLGLAGQGPLGWWVMYTIGTERLVAVWAGGMASRLASLAGGGGGAAPRPRVPLARS